MDIKRLQELSGILTEGDVVNFPGNEERAQKSMADHEEKLRKDGIDRAEKQRVGSGAEASDDILHKISIPFIDKYLHEISEHFNAEFDKHPELSQAAQSHAIEQCMEYLTSHIVEEFDPQ